MNLTKHRQAIERLYTDRATISRMAEAKDPVTKETKQSLQPIYMDQSCRLSQTGLPKDGQTEAQNDIKYEAKLFIAPEIEIKQGDSLTVTRGQITADGWVPLPGPAHKFAAGEPFPYSTHQEISLHREGYA